MQTATKLQEPSKTTEITGSKTTANPLQLQQPVNNPLQFTRKRARSHQPNVDVNDLEKYFKNESINNNSKLLFILINNHELTEDDADYIDLNKATAMMPDYDEFALNDAYESFFELQADEEEKEKQKKKDQQENPGGDKDKKHMGVLPTLKSGDRSIMLIGTEHGYDKPDYTNDLNDSAPEHADIVLEYPPLTNTGREQYTANDIGSVNDNTQTSLANSANGRRVIGGDGRKAFDEKQKLHTITIRHKEGGTFMVVDKSMPDEEIKTLATNYINAALGLNGTDAEAAIAPIANLVKYYDGTESLQVLINTFNLVKQLSEQLHPDRKAAIAGKVIQALNEDLINLNGNYISHLNETEIQLAKIQSLQEREKERSRLEKTTKFEFTGNKISFLHDAVCNLLLFTQVIASDRNMIVAFGAHHIAPLKELIEETANPVNSTSPVNTGVHDQKETSTASQMDLKERLHKLILRFLKSQLDRDPIYFNNCLIEAILNKLNINGEKREMVIEKIRKSLEETGIPKGEMLHATEGILNLIATEIRNETGIVLGTVTINYKHIEKEIQNNFENMDELLLNNLLDNITDVIPIGNGQNISITHTGYAHFE